MMGFVVVPFQAYLGVDQSEQFKHEFGPKLWGEINEFWYLQILATKTYAIKKSIEYLTSAL